MNLINNLCILKNKYTLNRLIKTKAPYKDILKVSQKLDKYINKDMKKQLADIRA